MFSRSVHWFLCYFVQLLEVMEDHNHSHRWPHQEWCLQCLIQPCNQLCQMCHLMRWISIQNRTKSRKKAKKLSWKRRRNSKLRKRRKKKKRRQNKRQPNRKTRVDPYRPHRLPAHPGAWYGLVTVVFSFTIRRRALLYGIGPRISLAGLMLIKLLPQHLQVGRFNYCIGFIKY